MVGCSVLTRPSSISGKPVCSATSVTGSPASASSFAVPPVDSSLTPSACRPRANSSTPVLSETEISAVVMVSLLLDQLVVEQLAPQRVAVDAQPVGGAALVAFGLLHHDLQQRLLHHAENHVVHAVGLHAAQVLEVTLQAVADALLDVFLAHASCARTSSLAARLVAGSRRWVSARRSKNAVTARSWAAQSSMRFIWSRKATPPGRSRTAQPMCLRALRTPDCSP